MSENGFEYNDEHGEPAPEQLRRIVAPPRPKKKGSGARALFKFLLYGTMLAVVAYTALNVFAPNKDLKRGAVYGYTPVKFSPEQLAAAATMGQQIAEHLSAGHGDDCQALTNWTVAMARIEVDVQKDMTARNNLRATINRDWAGQSPGLFRGILLDQGRNELRVDSAFLRLTQREGHTAALIRCAPRPARVEYHEVLIYPVKEDGGKLRVIDVYDLQTGIYATDRLRWAAVQESGVKSKENSQWLASFGPASQPHLLDLKTLISQDILKNGAAAFATIQTFPEALRQTSPLYALEYSALRNALDSPKQGLTDEMQARFLSLLSNPPSDAKSPLESSPMLAELFLKAGRQPEAEAELLKAYGRHKDGYLQYLISKLRMEKGDVVGAETAYQQAKKDAPQLNQLFNHGKAIDAAKVPAP